MIFYVDEDVSRRVALRVRSLGHEVVTTDEMGRKRADDEEQLFLARERGWVIVTRNRNDFLLIHRTLLRWAAEWGQHDIHLGILSLPSPAAVDEQARMLDVFVADGLSTANAFYEWRDPGSWTRVP